MWHLSARFCPLCGLGLAEAWIEGRARMRCSGCEFVLFQNPASAAAGVVLDGPRVLLVRRGIEPYRGTWTVPAGYQELDEDPRCTALREVREETGIEAEVVRLFDVLFVADDPRRPANVAVFLCRPLGGELRAGHDALEASWFELDRLPADLGFENGPRILERLRRGEHR